MKFEIAQRWNRAFVRGPWRVAGLIVWGAAITSSFDEVSNWVYISTEPPQLHIDNEWTFPESIRFSTEESAALAALLQYVLRT